ncbi:MAG: radical SAM protein [Bacillales bacterium]|nr:radical SAM protein [Bacillales bacterium]
MHYTKVKGLLSTSNGMNIYRGCTHGCIYCDSRSKCYHIDHEFTDMEVKENAPELLEEALKKKRNKCMIGTGSMSDPYAPIEKNIGYTRKCLEIIDKYHFGVTLQTKSSLVLKDLDVLKRINSHSKVIIQMTLTTYDEDLCKILEPNVSTTKERFETLKKLNEEGIETVVWISPILPFINDTEENIRGLLDYCIKAKVYGIIYFGAGVTLREGDREYFYKKLDEHFPSLKEKYIRKYGNSYEVLSDNDSFLSKIVKEEGIKAGIVINNDQIFSHLRQYPKKDSQLTLF